MMSIHNRILATKPVRGYAARKIIPVVEAVEARTLLSGVIAGTVFLDAANAHLLSAADAYLPGATVQLFQVGNATPIATAITDTNGAYAFPNLTSGDYLVHEVPPTGYQASGAEALSQIETAAVLAADTIKVTVPADPVYANYGGIIPGGHQTFTDQVNNNPAQVDRTGPLQFSSGNTPGGTDLNAGFASYCLNDLQILSPNGGDQFQVLLKPITATTNSAAAIPADRAGRIAFLYNHFGTSTLSNIKGPALQLAIWELLYDTGATADFSTGNFKVLGPVAPTDQTTMNAVIAQAVTYFNDSSGKSEAALFLEASTPVGASQVQSLIATGSFNFGVTPSVNPQPASLSGFVYCDANRDGVKDEGDIPIAGSTIVLSGNDRDGNVIGRTTSTDASGLYQFLNLPAGTYSVTQTTQPAGLVEGTNTQGTPGTGTVSGDSFQKITLDAGVIGENNDFGELGQAVAVTDLKMYGIHHQTTRIALTLDGPVDALAAGNPANYTLIALGKDQRLGSPTNHRPAIASVTYDESAGTITIQTVRHLNIHYHYLLSVNLPGANACNPPVNDVKVFSRSSVPYFDVHGKTIPAPALTAHQRANDAKIVGRALARWNLGRHGFVQLAGIHSASHHATHSNQG